MDRLSKVETLEKRELLAAEILDTLPPSPHAVFAPGTPQDYIDQWEHDFHAGEDDDDHGHGGLANSINVPGARWTNPSGGPSPNIGDGATVSWSIIPDGTGVAGTPDPANSNLVAFLDGIYGGGPADATIENKPWFPLFQRAFDTWELTTGIDFVYEPNDDGLAQGAPGAVGETGVRADMRIGGARIDGDSNTLAFNFFPGNNALAGDMVIDTDDSFYVTNANGPTGENRGLLNVVMHEIGHGIGLGHVFPGNNTKLMEPRVSLNFFGPQHDDLLAAHSLYGDRFSDNDTAETATPLGAITEDAIEFDNLSIDSNTDTDWFSFEAEAGQLISVGIAPTGESFQVQTIDGDENTGPLEDVNSQFHSDLELALFDVNGNLVQTVNANALGENESISGFPIAESGTYSIRVLGTSMLGHIPGTVTQTQFYSMSIQQSNASDPSLIAVSPNDGQLFDLDPTDQATNVLNSAPTEVTLTFGGSNSVDPNTLEDAISVAYSESGDFADGNTVDVLIGFVELGPNGRNATVRFAENLADGFYQISVNTSLSNRFGIPFLPNNAEPVPGNPDLAREVIAFEVETGGKVVAVVPQPVVPGVVNNDFLRQIEVYFDDADLFRAGSTIDNPAFYQLVATQNTVTTEDDVVETPDTVTLDADARKAVLTFGTNLNELVAPGQSLRLRIGDQIDFTGVTLATDQPAFDPGLTGATDSAFSISTNPTTGNWSTLVAGQSIFNVDEFGIFAQDVILPVDNPGAQNEPGHRDIEVENHFFTPDTRDFDDRITVIEYTFLRDTPYAFNSSGSPLFNQINADQEERFLEVLDIYSSVLGIDFIETETDGLTLIVGDLSTASPLVASAPGGVAGLGGPGGVTMDALDFGDAEDNQFGGSFFEVALHEVGHAIGQGHTFDLPPGTTQGSSPRYPDNVRPGPFGPLPFGTEPAYPGVADVIHGLHLHQRESLDVDMFRVEVVQQGVINVQTFAERLPDASLLDTRLALYRQVDQGLELISSNDDYFGADSFIELGVEPGTYFVGVSSTGNSRFDPNSGLTASGGTSEGEYELRIDFRSQNAVAIQDADGSLLDGDRDGVAGGNYDFWFEPVDADAVVDSATIFVDKTAPDNGDGQLATPFNNIPAALAAAESRISTTHPDGVVVRLLPNGGDDDDLATAGDNLAYEIGRIASLNQTLDDGRNLDVPAGVHLVVDAGVVMKFLDSRISVGSDDDGDDRSGGSISVQGTPELPVHFTSFNDQTIGSNSNVLGTAVATGDWGGIEIRNDVDRLQGRLDLQRQGIFQNYINNAIITYGGGEVSTIGRTVDPIQLSESRPEISYNTITRSSSAAISADPNSFEITTFAEPRFQQASISGFGFATDYDRQGPSIDGNTLINNSTNGLFVRIDTPAGGELETLTVTARFDDTDIVHVLGESLVVDSNLGGPVRLSTRPDPILGIAPQTPTTPLAGGGLDAGQYQYSYTFVDELGFETIGSLVQTATVNADGDQVALTNIPVANGKFVGRRLYRLDPGTTSFSLVANLDRTSRNFVDTVNAPDPTAPTLNPSVEQVVHGRPDPTLVIDPGLILKSQGARIEVGLGSNLIAEGAEGREIVLTARGDDSFGAGGTFDTNSDGQGSSAVPGAWGGIYAFPHSRISIDQALVTFAGGVTGTSGGTASFNAVQIHQAEARIANSVFRNNADGLGGSQGDGRTGFSPNEEATIYVTNAQPTLVGNTFIDNAGSAININVTSMNADFLQDPGRQSGEIGLFDSAVANQGPLFRGNRFTGNDVNGLEIRGEVLTTEVVWDDTDIVHVLRSDIEIPDFHTFGGLRLESSATESLVVKADNAEILATGRSLDIPDRIGGRLIVLGQPGFPVVITSVNDNTIGAGFEPDGSPQTETVPGGGPSSGDWQGLRFDEYSHDRNVATVTEREGQLLGFGDNNSTIGQQQDLGLLAENERSGDENIRLGFTVEGAIAAPQDIDLYSFEGVSGSLVWFDIDRTDPGLDTVLELIDGDGRVLALSQNSRQENGDGELTFVNSDILPDGHALPMQLDQDAFFNVNGGYRDLYTTNDGDSAMRVLLPGTTGTRNTFFIRVRSANTDAIGPADYSTEAGIAQSLVLGGRTSGGYQLQVRLQEIDEIGGSVVRFADLRYATNAIVATGLPARSAIAGELFNPGGVLDLGSFTNTDRAALSIAGTTDLTPDIYEFTVGRDGLQGLNPTDNSVSLVIDIDWADGLTRPDTNVFLFDGTSLIAIGTDSNVADDQVTPIIPGLPTLESDQSRGSLGNRDAYIGPLELGPDGNYRLVVAGPGQVPAELAQFFDADAANPLARLEPIDSVVRIIDDRFDFAPGTGPNSTPIPPGPEGPEAVQVGFEDDGSNVIPFQFGDIPLITIREDANNNGSARLSIYNAFTGRHDAIIDESTANTPISAAAQSLSGNTLAIRNAGNATQNDNNTSTTYTITADGVLTELGTTGIQTFENFVAANGNDTNRRVPNGGSGVDFVSLAFYDSPTANTSFAYGLANRGDFNGSDVEDGNGQANNIGAAVPRNADNLIYRLNPDTGAAISRRGTDLPAGFESANPLDPELANAIDIDFPPETPWAGTNVVAQLQIPFVSPTTGLDTGVVTSLVTDVANGDFLYAFTDQGAVWEIAIFTGNQNNSFSPGDLVASAPTADGEPAFPTLLVDPTVDTPVPGVDSITNAALETLVFEQVTKGPANFLDEANETVRLDSLYFGVGRVIGEDPDVRRFYAFDLTTRTAQTVFSFSGESVEVDATEAGGEFAGFFFSPLDQSLWHTSDTLRDAPGHGFGELDDRNAVIGGGSLRFGFDALNDDFNHLSSQSTNGDGGIVSDESDDSADLDGVDLQGFSGYNFLGGAHGSVQSNVIDLSGISAEDQPNLYFTYLLDTENTNADDDAASFNAAGLDDVARDTLRVTVAGEDGVWRLVATNNIVGDIEGRIWEDSRASNHEYDPFGSVGYTEVTNQRFVQELFDGDGFRQARIDLGPWAGQENVRIRFEFSTAGEARPDQSEVFALPGVEIADGQTISISGLMPDNTVTLQGEALVQQTKVFEFDHGLIVQVPGGSSITTPTALTGPGGTILTIAPLGQAGDVNVLLTDSAADVADKVTAFLASEGQTVARNEAQPAWVQIVDPTLLEGEYVLDGFSSAVISRPGIRPTSDVAIPIDISMSATEFDDTGATQFVRREIQAAFAEEIRFFDSVANLQSFPVVGRTNAIRIYDLSVSQSGPGFITSAAGNDDAFTSQSLDGLWSLDENPNISESTVTPHVSVTGFGDGSFDVFSFTIQNPGDVATFDIDGATFDSELHLLDAFGVPVVDFFGLPVGNDDGGTDPGSIQSLDANFTHVFDSAGTFMIAVGAFDSEVDPVSVGFIGPGVPEGGHYVLHVSVTNQPVETVGTATPLQLIQGQQSGPSNVPGSVFGVYAGGETSRDTLLRAGERSRGLGGENGVYLDDIVIGLADRGESFSGGTLGDALVDNPFFEALIFDGSTPTGNPIVEELEVGPYQLEIRAAREYLGEDNDGKDFRVQINERLTEAFNVTVTSSGAELIDGDTFTLSNGFDTLTFEFNDVTETSLATPVTGGNIEISYRIGDTPAMIADEIRDVINSGSVNAVLGAFATTQGGDLNSNTDPVIFFHGYTAATATGGVSFESPQSGLTHLQGEVTGLVLDPFTGLPAILGEDNGDSNRVRPQGVFIVDSNVISFSSGTAINVSSGSTAPGNKVAPINPGDNGEGERPKPGAPANLATLSTENLVHGAVVQNNLLISNGNGILLAGNPDQGGPAVYSRILNNTVFSSGIGIDVAGTAAPTLLNNVLVDNALGLRGNGGPGRVIRGTVFDGNGVNVAGGISAGTETIINPAGPLFVNASSANFGLAAGNPNFYPAAGSALIDTSIETQQDRTSIIAVKDELDIPRSPIVVTQRDLAGQIRRNGSGAGGQGVNIDIDRGALDRSDNAGPTATIIIPADNDADFIDADRSDTFLQLTSGVFNFFEVLIGDGSGIGPNQSTVTPQQVLVLENGRPLAVGSEYIHAYNVANRTLRLTPTAGIWRPDAVYEIVMLNQLVTLDDGETVSPIEDLAGNRLQANRPDGQTRFTIVMPEIELDFADSVLPSSSADNYPSLLENNGARHAIIGLDSPRLGRLVDSEPNFAGTLDSDDLPATVTVDGNVREAGDGPFVITANGTSSVQISLPVEPADGTTISVTAGDKTAIFELVAAGSAVSVGSIPVEISPGSTVQEISEVLAAAMIAELPARNLLAVASFSAADNVITLQGQSDEDGAQVGPADIGGVTLDHVFLDSTTGELLDVLNPLDSSGAELQLLVTGSGFVDAWVDFNGDGDFNDAGERVLDSAAVFSGINTVTLFTPANASVANNDFGFGNTRARFRISSGGGLSPGGLAVDGEVEDFNVTVAKALVPLIAEDVFSVNEDETLDDQVTQVVANTDVNDPFQYEIITGPANGQLTDFDPTDGSFTYVPDANFFGDDSFSYRVVTQSGIEFLGSVRSATIAVQPVNDAPTLDPIADITADEDDVVPAVNLTGIDDGPLENQPLAVTVTSSNTALVTNESINVDYSSPDTIGSFDFQLQPSQFGETTFTVTVTDGGNDGDLATPDDNGTFSQTFVLTVENVVNVPVPADDFITSDEDEIVTLASSDLTANDSAPDLMPSQQLTVVLDPAETGTLQTITTALGATVTLDTATGQIIYDPTDADAIQMLAPGASTVDTFDYFVNDGTLSDPLPSATVTLTIAGINDAPTVVDDVVISPTIPSNPSLLNPILIRPLANDFDIDGTLVINSVIVTQEPQFGSIARRLVSDGNGGQVVELAYSPFANFAGNDSFTYTVADNLGQQSPEATVVIRPSVLPQAGPDIGGGVAADGITINVAANDVPTVGLLDLSTLTIVRQGSSGLATANADGSVTYVPDPGSLGVDSFDYTIADSEGNVSDPVTVLVNIVSSGMQNPIRFSDVDANGEVTALDALLIINRLSAAGSDTVIVADSDRGPNFFDVSGNGEVTALDALLVVNSIGQPAPTLEGEFETDSDFAFSGSLQSVFQQTLVAPATSLPRSAGGIRDDFSSSEFATDAGTVTPSDIGSQADDDAFSGSAPQWVQEDLISLLASDADDRETDEAISEEFATDLAFKLLR